MWTFPPEWEDALWQAAAKVVPPAALEPRVLAAAIIERTRRYTSERSRLTTSLPPRERARDLAARALFFTVADAAKIAIPVAELQGRGLLPGRAPLRVLDVGAGAGAMTLGLAAVLPGRSLEVVAVDRDAGALDVLVRAAGLGPGAVAVTPVVGDLIAPLPAGIEGRFELILAGSVLNELPDTIRMPLVRSLLGRLAEDGALIIVEPALRETARALHEVRDLLLAEAACAVFAPCTRRLATCPARDDPRDWCHEDRPFQPSPRLAALVRATGLRREGLKLAYLTLRRHADPLVTVEPGVDPVRVVSGPLDSKGLVARIVCGDHGRVQLRVLRRDRSDQNRELGAARRGDVLLLRGEPPVIERLEPAGR